MSACCLPESVLQCLLNAYRGRKGKGLTVNPIGDVNLGNIPFELLPEIALCLPLLNYKDALAVAPSWYMLLSSEQQWQQISTTHWPGVTTSIFPMCKNWRDFATRGGGLMLGSHLFQYLRSTSEGGAMKCRQGHNLHRCLVEQQGFRCDECGCNSISLGSTRWSCRRCDYDKCQNCYNTLHAPQLLANGATNCCSKDGWTSLHYSSRLGFTDTVECLIEARADINVGDLLHGYTPLMVSATHGQAEVCSLLLSCGASKTALNKYGRTALDCARTFRQEEVQPLLISSDDEN